jgi:hypothetical protein
LLALTQHLLVENLRLQQLGLVDLVDLYPLVVVGPFALEQLIDTCDYLVEQGFFLIVDLPGTDVFRRLQPNADATEVELAAALVLQPIVGQGRVIDSLPFAPEGQQRLEEQEALFNGGAAVVKKLREKAVGANSSGPSA